MDEPIKDTIRRIHSEAHEKTMGTVKALDDRILSLEAENRALLKMLRRVFDGRLPPCIEKPWRVNEED